MTAGARAWWASCRPSPRWTGDALAAASRAQRHQPTRGGHSLKVVLYVDGGARGNPGPAAAAAVLCTPDGAVLEEASELLGEATNNVAEYRALLLGLRRARALGASEVEIINDSQLVARQVTGEYKVKHEAMRPLHRETLAALGGFERWSISSVPRSENVQADALVNALLDSAGDGARA